MNSVSPSRNLSRSDRVAPAFASATGMELSPGQLSFWLAQMLDHGDPSLNIGECVEILGAVDAVRFDRRQSTGVLVHFRARPHEIHVQPIGPVKGGGREGVVLLEPRSPLPPASRTPPAVCSRARPS